MDEVLQTSYTFDILTNYAAAIDDVTSQIAKKKKNI